MFNNLGLSGGIGLPGLRIPIIRNSPVRRLPIRHASVPRCGGSSIGGAGNDIINIGTGIPGPVGPPGPIGPEGPPGTPGLVPVTTVIETPYNAVLTDYMLAVNVAAPTSIVLPISPIGTVFVIKDIDGDASINNITVSGLGSTIDGSPSALINVDYGSITLIFNGTEWNIV